MALNTNSDDEYYIMKAFQLSLQSKDPRTKVGACIVKNEGENKDERIVGEGYNKMIGIPESEQEALFKKRRFGDEKNVVELDKWINTKYPYILHAEMDAIMNAKGQSLEGCTMYSLVYPWNECAKLIIASGIKRLVYLNDKYSSSKYVEASKKMFQTAEVEYVQFQLI